MQKDLDISGVAEEQQALLLKWWDCFYPGHLCKTFTHKYMCKACMFIIYSWLRLGFRFWGYELSDEVKTVRIGEDWY